MSFPEETRRRFLNYFSGIGLGTTLLPGVLWAEMQQPEGDQKVTVEMLKAALALSGLTFSDEDQKAMLPGVNQNLPASRNCASCIFRTTSRRRFTSARSCRA